MKSIEQIKKETKLSDKCLLNAFRACVAYYLSDEELKPFLVREVERRYLK